MDLNGEIKGIRTDISGIRADLGELRECYAVLAERMKHPCSEHADVVARLARAEATRNGERFAGRRTSGILHTWFMGIAVIISLAAILIAFLT